MGWNRAARALAVCALILAQCLVSAGEPSVAALERKARKLAAKGDYAGAYLAAEQAVARRPDDPALRALAATYQRQGLQGLRAFQSLKPAPETKRRPALPEATAEDRRELAPPPMLQPDNVRRSFDLRENPRALIAKVAEAYGIRVVFDSDYPPSEPPRRLHIDNASWSEAIYALQLVANAFYVPLNSRMALFAKETAVKRGEVEPNVSVAIPFPDTMSAQDLQDVANAVRQAFGLTKVAIDSTQRAMVLRDRLSRVRPAVEIARQLMNGPGEVYVDVDLVELDSNSNLGRGLQLQTSFPIVDFGSKALFNNKPSIPAGFTNFQTWGGGASYLGVGISSAQLMATLASSLGHSITSTSLRSVSGQPATIHIGDKYPIVQSAYVSPAAAATNGPSITALSPSSAAAGSGALALVISGSNFTSASVVYWIVNSTQSLLPSSFVNSTQLTATVSATLLASAGSAGVEVQNGSGGLTATSTFTITSSVAEGVPAIGSLMPSSAAAGGDAFTLIINGANFAADSAVYWTENGTEILLSPTFVNSTQLTVPVPANLIASEGSAQITVQNGIVGTAPASTFTITPPSNGGSPVINSLSPESATAGGGAFTLQVGGANFTADSVVYWTANGLAIALQTTYVNSTQLSAYVPASLIATSGSAPITVIDSTSGASPASAFTITAATAGTVPVINSFSPSSVPAGGGAFTLLISGSNFDSLSSIYWVVNGALSALEATYVNSTQLAVSVPATQIETEGSAQITIVESDTGASSAPGTFNITAATSVYAPVVTSLSPASASAGEGALTLIVSGANFTPDAVVLWTANGTQQLLTTTYINSTQLTASLSADLVATAGSAEVLVRNSAGAESAPSTFTINSSASGTVPAITGLSPSIATVGGSAFTLNISGANFTSDSAVYWTFGGVQTQLPATFINSTLLSASVPAGSIATAGVAEINVENPAGAVSAASTFTINSPPGTGTSTAATAGVTLSNAYAPSIQFEDLGINLKLTAHVHDADSLTLECEAEFKQLTGDTNIGIPVISNRKFTTTVRLRFGEVAVIAGLAQESHSIARTGFPGLIWIPWLHQDTVTRQTEHALLILRPRLMRLPPAEFPAHAVWTGTEVRALPLDFWDRAVTRAPGLP